MSNNSVTNPAFQGTGILSISDNPYTVSNSTFNPNDTIVKGQMVSVSFVMTQSEVIHMQMDSTDFKNTVKKKLCQLMAEKMYKENLFSFTMLQSPQDYGQTFFARMFVTPNDQTQIIRQTQTLANR